MAILARVDPILRVIYTSKILAELRVVVGYLFLVVGYLFYLTIDKLSQMCMSSKEWSIQRSLSYGNLRRSKLLEI